MIKSKYQKFPIGACENSVDTEQAVKEGLANPMRSFANLLTGPFSPLLRSGENAPVKPELLSPLATLRENKEFKTDAPSGHGLTAALGT